MAHSARWTLVLFAAFICTSSATAQRTTAGKEFWLAFPKNAKYEFGQTIRQQVIVTAMEDAEVTVSAPAVRSIGKVLAQGVKITKGDTHTFEIDSAFQTVLTELTEDKGVHVGSTGLISVIAVSARKASNDSYRIMPAEALGREYMVVGYDAPLTDRVFTTQFTTIAAEDNTSITINLTGKTKARRKAGEQINVKLDRGQCYTVQGEWQSNEKDLTGSTVVADKPIAVLTGHSCAQIPFDRIYCDVLIEMAAPIASAGIDFIAPRMQDKEGYALRVVATRAGTVIHLGADSTGIISDPISLNAGEYSDILNVTDNQQIHSNKPVIVAQFALSNEADSNRVGDPFMTLIAPTSAYTSNTTFSTPPLKGSWRHYLSIVCDKQASESLSLNGKLIPSVRSERVEGSDYVVFQTEVGQGTQEVTSTGKLAVYSYGFGTRSDNYDSYGTYCGPW